jgi:hypothetical protein
MVRARNTHSDYVAVGGIQMPQKTITQDGTTHIEKIQINVAYNEEIFLKAVSLADGPGVWRPKKRM